MDEPDEIAGRSSALVQGEKRREGAEDRAIFQNYSFNFDSASGIIYTVDVRTKPQGEKITITSMADGSPFRMDKIYIRWQILTVAMVAENC